MLILISSADCAWSREFWPVFDEITASLDVEGIPWAHRELKERHGPEWDELKRTFLFTTVPALFWDSELFSGDRTRDSVLEWTRRRAYPGSVSRLLRDIESSRGAPRFVYFAQRRCPVCQKFESVFECVHAEKKDVALLRRVEIDDPPLAAKMFGIRGVPTILYIGGGKMIAYGGQRSCEAIVEWMEKTPREA